MSSGKPQHFWMVTWQNRHRAWMSLWAKHMKGNQSKLWKHAAHCTVSQFLAQPYFSKTCQNQKIIVIDPSQKPDHSYWFAFHFSAAISAQHLPYVLVKNSQASQKFLNRHQRQLVIQQYSLKNTDEIKQHLQDPTVLWIFIDDIVTTGATWKSAYQLLGKPSSFLVISWLQRSFEGE